MEREKAEIASLVEKYGRVQSLMKYVNSDTLKESYRRQPKGKAVGTDGVTKEEYGEKLEENIEDLIARMKKFSYKPYPVRRAYIPKGNGKMRGLGIPSFEDIVVQGVFKEILEAIYEPKFKEFSFGFWPGRSCHDAIQRVNKHIMADKVNYILDADIKGFFESRILPFGRYKGTKESFDFLGFTHYNATSHWGKYCVLHRTSKKKLKTKREAVKKWIWEHMHESIADTIEALNVKLTGHYRYYGIYGNYVGLQKYYKYVREELWKSKRRRDQTYWLTWRKYRNILKIHPLEYPRIYLKSAY